MRGKTVSFRGDYFDVTDYVLRPSATYRPRPRIYLGGESQPARALAADMADVWFINGQPLADVRRLIDDAAARPRPGQLAGTPLRFGLSAFVIARDTDAEALAAYDRLLSLARQDAVIRAAKDVRTDSEVVMKQTMAKFESVGTNGGTAAGLVGSYDTVAERIAAFHAAGVETLLVQFQPFEREMRRFARYVMPRLAELRIDPRAAAAE